MVYRSIIFFLLFISCAQSQRKPTYIYFHLERDSLFVVAKNPTYGKSFLKITDKNKSKDSFVNFTKPGTETVLKFQQSKVDTAKVLKNYKFTLYYGTPNFKKYDSLYNYGLPFLKGKRYKILQGQNSTFTHKGNLSSYAIDFKMDIGQEVCAIRDGLVISIKEDSNQRGRNKKYRNDANFIIIAHKDGTFAQYVHLKKDGVLVSKNDTVKKGQVIGYSGNTGMSTEPHLHFAVYKPTKNGLVSIPYILNFIPTKRYKKGKFAFYN
jgi:murein DD-endopeptidase MepM/ murein hydrolase activator NlpD